MKARSVARELALFVLFQLDKKGEKLDWEKASLQEIVVDTVRSLTHIAHEQIQALMNEIVDLRDAMMDHEVDHPLNENIPTELPTVPVPIPTTHEMIAKLERLMQAAENLNEALYLPEVNALSDREDVRNYCRMLVGHVVNHQEEIDRDIDAAAQGWRVERLHKMDLMLMRLALAELRYANVDAATVIDEIMDLANRFTEEESRKFIHGILGGITGTAVGAAENV
jgi:transcription antitermination factor NusB